MTDRGCPDRIVRSNRTLAFPNPKAISYVANILIGKFGIRVRGTDMINKPKGNGSPRVLLPSHILKVLKPVVRLVPIYMVNLVTVWTGANKGSQDHSVNKMLFSLPLRAKADNHVLLMVVVLLHQATSLVVMPFDRSADIAKIRHFVKRFVIGDWFKDFHDMYLLTSVSHGKAD